MAFPQMYVLYSAVLALSLLIASPLPEDGKSTVAHMVLPQARHNVWQLANKRHPGGDISVVHQRLRPGCDARWEAL